MTSYQKKVQPRPNRLLGCFGVAPRTPASGHEKSRKFGGQKKFLSRLRLCLPKIRVACSPKEKKKVSLDAKLGGANDSQSIKVEESKVEKMRLDDYNHASKTQEEPSGQQDQSNDAVCHKEELDSKFEPKPKGNRSRFGMTKDSLIGVFIIAMILEIMSIWGRLCAILCMSACFYCVPLLRGIRDINIVTNEYAIVSSTTQLGSRLTSNKFENKKLDSSLNLDIDSEMYKKKVVLEGLLQRAHKLPIGKSFS